VEASPGAERPFVNPYLAIIIGVVAVSFSAIFTKLAEAPPLVIAFYRLAFTVLLITPFALNRAGRRELKQTTGRELALAALAGLLLAAHFAVWISSLNYTTVASSTILVTMQPLFVVTGAYLFLKEGLTARALIGAGLALTGSVLIGINDFQMGGTALYGDLLAFSGALFVAGYVLIGRTLRARLPIATYTFVVFGTAAAALLLANLATSTPLYPYPQQTWAWFLALAVVPTILGHMVFNWSLRYVKAAVVSVSILGEPVGATTLAYFIFGEVPGLLQLAGGAVIATGLYVFITSVAGPRTVPAPAGARRT